MSDLIQVERDGLIATVVLDRPAKSNALTPADARRGGEVRAVKFGDFIKIESKKWAKVVKDDDVKGDA